MNIYIYIYIIDMCKYIYSHVIFSAWFIVCSNSVHKGLLANRLLTPISCFPLEVYLLKSWVICPVHLPAVCLCWLHIRFRVPIWCSFEINAFTNRSLLCQEHFAALGRVVWCLCWKPSVAYFLWYYWIWMITLVHYFIVGLKCWYVCNFYTLSFITSAKIFV